MIILDASVLIAHLEPNDVHHDRGTALLAARADQNFGVSPLTLAEVYVGPAQVGQLNDVKSAIRDLAVFTVELTPTASEELAVLRAQTRLRLPDCCVLLAATTIRGAVATFDERLAASAETLGLDTYLN